MRDKEKQDVIDWYQSIDGKLNPNISKAMLVVYYKKLYNTFPKSYYTRERIFQEIDVYVRGIERASSMKL